MSLKSRRRIDSEIRCEYDTVSWGHCCCIHIEQRPHRFDRLREDNPKEWHYWMYECCTDSDGEKYGWGRVLDYIGVKWEDIPESNEQISLFDMEEQP